MRTIITLIGTLSLFTLAGCDADLCTGTNECKMEGKCKDTGKRTTGDKPICVVGENAHCQLSDACESAGQCKARSGACQSDAGASTSGSCTSMQCVVTQERHCSNSTGCTKAGNCRLSANPTDKDKAETACKTSICTCVPGKSSDCEDSTDCDEEGLCSLYNSQCAALAGDCTGKVCTEDKRCKASGGKCI